MFNQQKGSCVYRIIIIACSRSFLVWPHCLLPTLWTFSASETKGLLLNPPPPINVIFTHLVRLYSVINFLQEVFLTIHITIPQTELGALTNPEIPFFSIMYLHIYVLLSTLPTELLEHKEYLSQFHIP